MSRPQKYRARKHIKEVSSRPEKKISPSPRQQFYSTFLQPPLASD